MSSVLGERVEPPRIESHLDVDALLLHNPTHYFELLDAYFVLLGIPSVTNAAEAITAAERGAQPFEGDVDIPEFAAAYARARREIRVERKRRDRAHLDRTAAALLAASRLRSKGGRAA